MASESSDDPSSEKHLILKPEEASLLDLFRILFSGDIEKAEFIECLKVNKHRGIIFFSVIVQKALQSVAMPLSCFGSNFELWLNLLSCNRNLGVLLLNLVQRKVVMPDNESAMFLSTVGFLDWRVELDSNIKPGDGRYYPSLSAMASKLAYENKAFIKATVEDRWKMEFLGAYDFWNEYQQKSSTQAFMLHNKIVDPDTVIVAFRGSKPFDVDAWCTDCDISWYMFQGIGKVHGGFMKALGLQKDQSWPQNIEQDNDRLPLAYYFIREKLRKTFQTNNRAKFILTGHSMGGALAILFPAVLALHKEAEMLERLEAVYTFGQPRVGDSKFGEFMEELFRENGVKYYRFVYSLDIVPRLPHDNSTLMFKHFGTCLYFNCCYQGKRVTEAPYKNYFSLLSFIPKRLNAAWEILRSFMIPYRHGPDYRETLLLKMFRMFGLVFPGFPAHSLQDYVNATRLGSTDLFL